MKYRKLDARGFSHDLLIVFVVVIMAVSGVAYYVQAKADASTPTTPNIKLITLMSGSITRLCLDSRSTTPKEASPVDVVSSCKTGSATQQSWELDETGNQVTVEGQLQPAYEVKLANTSSKSYCIGVNAPNGQLALTQNMANNDQKDKNGKPRHRVPNPLVQLFTCRVDSTSFSHSFQQWVVINHTLVNANPGATPDTTPNKGKPMCMTTAPTSETLVHLSICSDSTSTGQTQAWRLPMLPVEPVVTLQITPTNTKVVDGQKTVTKGQTVSLKWLVANATTCTASRNPAEPTDGLWNWTHTITASSTPVATKTSDGQLNKVGPYIYTLGCTGAGGTTITEQAVDVIGGVTT